MVDVSPLKEWFGLIALMISVGSSIVLFLRSGVKEASATLAAHDRRIQAVEAELQHVPSKEALHELQLDLTEMKGQMVSMVKSSEAVERATRRMEDFLMKKGS